MKTKSKLAAGLVALVISMAALAGSPRDLPSIEEMKQRLAKAYPATKFGLVAQTPIEGLYSVELGSTVAYVSTDTRYFLFGRLFDMHRQIDVTPSSTVTDPSGPQIETTQPKIQFSELPFSESIKFVNGTGKHRLAVFADPECPFCKRLETELAALPDSTVFVFPLPLTDIHPDAAEISLNILCSEDPVNAWRNYLTADLEPQTRHSDCERSLTRTAAFAEAHGISGTPMIVLESGRVLAGFTKTSTLSALLEEK